MAQSGPYVVQQASYRSSLREALEKPGGATVVLGTGVSAALSGNHRVATWKGLLHAGLDWYASGNPEMTDNVEHFRAVLDNSPNTEMLVAIAQFVGGQFRKSGKGQYQRWLTEQIGNLYVHENSDLVGALPSTSWILTTNYDDLWKTSYRDRQALTWRTPNAHQVLARNPEKYVFHLHGIFSDHESVILSGEDYGRLGVAAVSQEVLRDAARRSSLVLIGYGAGLSDPNFFELTSWLQRTQGDSTDLHFSLVTDDCLPKFEVPNSGIVGVSYGRQHRDLGDFLRKIAPKSGALHGDKMRSCKHPASLPPRQERSPLPADSTGFVINPRWNKAKDKCWQHNADIQVRLDDDRPTDCSRIAYLIPSGSAPLRIHDPTFWPNSSSEYKRRISEEWCTLREGQHMRGYVFDLTRNGDRKTRVYCDDYDRYLTEQDRHSFA